MDVAKSLMEEKFWKFCDCTTCGSKVNMAFLKKSNYIETLKDENGVTRNVVIVICMTDKEELDNLRDIVGKLEKVCTPEKIEKLCAEVEEWGKMADEAERHVEEMRQKEEERKRIREQKIKEHKEELNATLQYKSGYTIDFNK